MSRVFKPLPPPLTVGEPLPKACDAKLVARVFGVSLHTIYDWKRDGKLRRFELPKPLGSKRWSGAKLQEFCDNPSRPMALERAS